MSNMRVRMSENLNKLIDILFGHAGLEEGITIRGSSPIPECWRSELSVIRAEFNKIGGKCRTRIKTERLKNYFDLCRRVGGLLGIKISMKIGRVTVGKRLNGTRIVLKLSAGKISHRTPWDSFNGMSVSANGTGIAQ